MDIYDAIDSLEEVYDSNVPYIGDEDAEKFANALEVIYQFARKYEPRAEDLPMEHTCDCGTHMTRERITPGGDAEFICPKCNAIWYLGRAF